MMSLIGNILWIIFGGLISAVGWFLAGILCCITVIGIPIGIQCFKFSSFVLFPFGRNIDYGSMHSGSVILNILWILLCGLELAAASCIMGVICCITILGIPFGLQHFKFAMLAFMPFGATIHSK